jgi:hypothetical protein
LRRAAIGLGHDRRDADRRVGDVDRLRHDEGDGAHDRRHDLSTHRGRRFHRAREIGGIAEALHQGNCKLADGDDVGDAGAINRAHQSGRDHRHLSGAAARMPDRAHREIGEKRDHARAFKKRAEQNEQEDVSRGDVNRRAVDALGAEEHLVDDLAEIIAARIQRAREVLAEQGVA